MQLEIGAIIEGKVTGVTAYGAFVSLGDGKSGMVHISELSSGFVKEVNDIVKVNDTVKVKIIGIDSKGKISLSMKQAQEPKKDVTPIVKEQKEAPKPKHDSFEDMMARFKTVSDEKMSDLRRNTDSKQSRPGFSRRGRNYN